ncbi:MULTISPECIES: hypothetical protein [unclassified Streptomyces]|uniref:hypothetical protein n=1 Tax=unclassified Streptomyces TaxID=2593676 RepID=UPI0006AF4567|nr:MULTISPECIES: hypothetical protein [unclassified Streptomyces]KOX36549.1 hypothetical protein ADL06_04415 [Streptomyces sp. NRRL F-6491]KOX51741.1 hypothetical protein ADL08_03735 [Streptomyces sp. NRRL F-6492]
MLVSHALEDGTLHLRLLRELDVTSRAAAALEIEAIVSAYRPLRVFLEFPSPAPSPASYSALARARRMCASLGIALTVSGPGSVPLQAPGSAPQARTA